MKNTIEKIENFGDKITLSPDGQVLVTAGNLKFIVKHNDVGVSIDMYVNDSDEPHNELQFWFEDYEE